VKLNAFLDGVPKFVRAVELTNEHTRSRTIAAIERGTKAVAAKAREKVPRVSGELAQTIRDEYSKDRLVGYVKAGFGKLQRRSRASTAEGKARAKARREHSKLQMALANSSKQALSVADLGVYSPVVERGDPRRHHPAHPFLVPSLVEQKPSIIADLAAAPEKAAQEAGLT
jgi:hypothetical protein